MQVRWVFDRRKNILMLFVIGEESSIKKPAEVFEVERADIIIDANDGSILEIHIPVTNEEIKHILDLLRKKNLLIEK